jgi:hypothetical protein
MSVQWGVPKSDIFGDYHTAGDSCSEYCVFTLWRVSAGLPVTTLPAAMFETFLARKAWTEGEPYGAIVCDDHWQRMLNADLDFPVMFRVTETDEIAILDGYHRIAKAFLLDLPSVMAVDVTTVLRHAALAPDWRVRVGP